MPLILQVYRGAVGDAADGRDRGVMPAHIGQVTVDLVGVMPRCGDCRYWQPRPDVRSIVIQGACERITVLPSKAVIEPSYDPTALITDPDFGCIQFEAKS